MVLLLAAQEEMIFSERARLVDEVTLMAVVASSTVQTNIFRFGGRF